MGVGSRLRPEQLEALAAIGRPIGVKLFLEPGTRIRNWIRNQSLNIEVARESLFGKRIVRTLTIRRGEAGFFPGGGVDVKMPGSEEFWIAFPPRKVLEIRDLKNNSIIERNRYLCTECTTLTGETLTTGSGLELRVTGYKCTTCGYEWPAQPNDS